MKRLSIQLLISTVTFATAIFFAVILGSNNVGLSSLSEAAEDSLHIELNIQEPTLLYGMFVDDFVLVEDKIKRNQLLGDILLDYNVPANLIHQLSKISRSVFDVRKIVPD